MRFDKLVFGLLDTTSRHSTPEAVKLRSLTVSWSRFGYHGRIIEAPDINTILDRAVDMGYRYCLIQSYGHLITEHWYPKNGAPKSFYDVLCDWIDRDDFFVLGDILAGTDDWYGLGESCLLVNLRRYLSFGRPQFGSPQSEATWLVKPDCRSSADREPKLISLHPSPESRGFRPRLSGWRFIAESLKRDIPVYNLDQDIRDQTVSLQGHSLDDLSTAGSDSPNGRPARDGVDGFLENVRLQLRNSRRGVFIWNIESYADVQSPPASFRAPISTLYSVAAGFKPNMILNTHGFDDSTTVVFFDYSAAALEVRRLLDEEWDGEDYPRFLKHVFKRFPHPQTFYQLWLGVTPDNLDWSVIETYWQDEIKKWGGEQKIKDHWLAYKNVRREYVSCNLLTDSGALLERIKNQSGSVIWWSNAFFTIYSNWLYTIEQRKLIYDKWIIALAGRAPQLFLYGSDYNNISVNHIQAREYREVYSAAGADCLYPKMFHKHQIRS